MCWSFAASAIFALIGFGFAAHLVYKKESNLLWIPLGYFAIMETLQAITYFYLGNCSSPENQLLTFLAYMHIAFQPILINALILYFIPARFRAKIIWPVLTIASVLTILMLIKIYPFSWAGSCVLGSELCGKILCSYPGNWHLAWSIPFNDLGANMMAYYIIAVFVLPLLYGSWKTTVYSIIIGPLIAFLLTNNPNEWPAIWCLMSIGIILGIAIPYIRRNLHVKRWYFWEYPHRCEQCKHWWVPSTSAHPIKCPRCKSKYWHKK